MSKRARPPPSASDASEPEGSAILSLTSARASSKSKRAKGPVSSSSILGDSDDGKPTSSNSKKKNTKATDGSGGDDDNNDDGKEEKKKEKKKPSSSSGKKKGLEGLASRMTRQARLQEGRVGAPKATGGSDDNKKRTRKKKEEAAVSDDDEAAAAPAESPKNDNDGDDDEERFAVDRDDYSHVDIPGAAALSPKEYATQLQTMASQARFSEAFDEPTWHQITKYICIAKGDEKAPRLAAFNVLRRKQAAIRRLVEKSEHGAGTKVGALAKHAICCALRITMDADSTPAKGSTCQLQGPWTPVKRQLKKFKFTFAPAGPGARAADATYTFSCRYAEILEALVYVLNIEHWIWNEHEKAKNLTSISDDTRRKDLEAVFERARLGFNNALDLVVMAFSEAPLWN